jgi:hypothetical protein
MKAWKSSDWTPQAPPTAAYLLHRESAMPARAPGV